MPLGDSDEGNDWENMKENIQPLCTQRNESMPVHPPILNASKDVKEVKDVEQSIRYFKDLITTYEGDDPLEPWIDFIYVLEHSDMALSENRKKLKDYLKSCIKNFSGYIQYKNDRRFVALYIKLIKITEDIEVNRRCSALKKSLERGYGSKVADLYLAISELEESEDRFEDALKILQRGVHVQAEPVEKLVEALEGLQLRTPQRLTEAIKLDDDDNRSAVEENAETSVPVFDQEKTDPGCKTELDSAEPISTFRTPLPVYRSGTKTSAMSRKENQAGDHRSPLADISTSSCKRPAEAKENLPMDPKQLGTFNKDEMATLEAGFLVPATTDAPVEKLKLFGEDSTFLSEKSRLDPFEFSNFSCRSCRSILAKNTPVSSIHNGSCSTFIESVNVVSQKICENYGQVEMRHRKLWKEKEAMKQVKAQYLQNEVEQYEMKCRKLAIELHETTSKLNDYRESASLELHGLRTKNEELTNSNEELIEAMKSQDEQIHKYTLIVSNLRYRLQQLSDELEGKNKLIAELQMQLDEQSKPIASLNASGVRGTSSTCLEDNSNVTRNLSNHDLSFLPKLSSGSYHSGNETEKRKQCSPIALSPDNFNASVPMGTSYFMREDTHTVLPLKKELVIPQKLSSKQVHNCDMTTSIFLIPPPVPKKALKFNFYGNSNESLWTPMSHGPPAAPELTMSPPASMQRSVLENITPPTLVVPIVSKMFGTRPMYEIDGQSPVFGMADNANDEYHDGINRASNFDLSDLTKNLQLNRPLLNSTPKKFAEAKCSLNFDERRGNFIHTQPIPLNISEIEGPMRADVLARNSKPLGEEVDEKAADISRVQLSLSPIQETSDENKSSCTTGSNSGNLPIGIGGGLSSSVIP